MTTVTLGVLGESVVQVGDCLITPTSPQLFALMLFLGHAEGRAVHKAQIFELFFRGTQDVGRTSHNLRQLTYRLRRLGVPIETDGHCIRLPQAYVSSSLQEFETLTRDERIQIPASRLSILPDYEARVSRPFADWVEAMRSRAQSRVASVLREDLGGLRASCRWNDVVRVGRAIRHLGASTEEIACATAEALSMLGRKPEAIDELDAFLTECDPSCVDIARQLRVRIGRSSETRRSPDSAFHGRTETMQLLAEEWATSVGREPQVAIILGAAGIGKSRLAAEMRAFVALNGGLCVAYRCESSDGSRPLSVFRHVLPELRAMRGSLGASPDLRIHLDRLASAPNLAAPADPVLLEATRAELHAAIIDLVDSVVSERPMLLVIDDAQYLDPASRSILNALFSEWSGMQLMLLACYRGTAGHGLSVRRDRIHIHRLEALTPEDSRAVLQDLLPQRQDDIGFLDSCVVRAGGNPYFLHAMARSGQQDSSSHLVPFDVQAFAARAYFGLDAASRTLFDTCVLLGPFASIRRVRAVAHIDGPALLEALRVLEGQGLITLVNGDLRCAHALLQEAVVTLIPDAIAALLNERIAQCLEAECESSGYPASMTWAAARSWINAGDLPAASKLMQHCAAQAFSLGEPRLAADALLQIPHGALPPQERVPLLRALADYADSGGYIALVCSTLCELLTASKECGVTEAQLQEIELRIIEADLRHGAEPTDSVAALKVLLTDIAAPTSVRVRAGFRLLVAADMNLDAGLGRSTMLVLAPVLHTLPVDDGYRLRAELIYETVFGDLRRAEWIARRLLDAHPVPALTQAALSGRRNAAMALSRLGLYQQSNEVLEADFRFMLARGVGCEAAYRSLVLADNAIDVGDVVAANAWLQEGTRLVKDEVDAPALQAGYLSAMASLALMQSDSRAAIQFSANARTQFPCIGLRYQAVALALSIRARALREPPSDFGSDLDELKALYAMGGRLGAQDAIVEALWLAEHPSSSARASDLLREYLHTVRRETTAPADSLRRSTSADLVWESNCALAS